MTASSFDPLDWLDDELAALDAAGLRRGRRTRIGRQGPVIRLADGEVDGAPAELINFGSNDYLSLAGDPRLAAAAEQAARQEGWGAGASPLIIGHSAAHRQLEGRLAEFFGAEAALVFPSGFAANSGTIGALVGRGDMVFADERNHASLIDGCRLSRAEVRVFPHGDMTELAAMLGQSAGLHRRLVVTDTLFSMDGDVAPLTVLAELAERHRAMLMIDEAHAVGVFGGGGRGVAEQMGIENRITARVGTLSKALASAGGFVVGQRRLIEWLWNRARSYVFSTAQPPAVAAAAGAALDIVRDEPQRRSELLVRATGLREALSAEGFAIGAAAGQIVPIMLGDPAAAMAWSAELRRAGMFVPGIRPPSVPPGESLLRISLCYGHTPEMIARLVEGLRAVRKQIAK